MHKAIHDPTHYDILYRAIPCCQAEKDLLVCSSRFIPANKSRVIGLNFTAGFDVKNLVFM